MIFQIATCNEVFVSDWSQVSVLLLLPCRFRLLSLTTARVTFSIFRNY
ncbi:hypothetical protein LJC08_03085 [Methanimicrococcus sp. OttesenSCG-928-J09]|nr:hypothetical protein [Methanimicrococcus sp. OttesenSCG-928-J09]